jgi:hypothetical protein
MFGVYIYVVLALASAYVKAASLDVSLFLILKRTTAIDGLLFGFVFQPPSTESQASIRDTVASQLLKDIIPASDMSRNIPTTTTTTLYGKINKYSNFNVEGLFNHNEEICKKRNMQPSPPNYSSGYKHQHAIYQGPVGKGNEPDTRFLLIAGSIVAGHRQFTAMRTNKATSS